MKVFFSLTAFLLVSIAFSQNAFIRTYGNEGTFNEGKGIVAFEDTTYILAGNRETFGGQSSAWLFKINSTGNIVWEVYFNSYILSTCENLSRHDDTSVVICGTVLQGADYNMFAARVSSSGNVLWEKTFGTPVWDQGYCTTSDKYGNVWLTGYAFANDTADQDIIIYKLDGATGDSLLCKRINAGYDDKGVYIDTTSNDNLLLASNSYIQSNDSTISRIWRFDFNLDTIWTFNSFPDSSAIVINTLQTDTFKRILCYGTMRHDTATLFRMYGALIAENGSPMVDFFSPAYFLKNIRRCISDTCNVSHLTGSTFSYYFGFGNSDVGHWIDSASYAYYYYYGGLQEDEGADLDFAADGGMVFIGTTKSHGPGVTNIFLVKTVDPHDYNESDYAHYTPLSKYQRKDIVVYPNPSLGEFRINFQVEEKAAVQLFNLQGIEVFNSEVYSNEPISPDNISDGLYMIRITFSDSFYTLPLLLQHK